MNTKELLNIDWVTINYLIENTPLNGSEYHNGLLKFIPENHGTRQFRHVYQVFMEYEKDAIATIVCNPLSAILDCRLHQVKLSNWCLYQDNANKYLRVIKEALNAKFLSVSRLDLCVDMVGFDFYGFIKKYHDNELREKKPKEVTEHYKKYDNGSIYTGISWGSKLSDWTAKIYDKIREINEVSGKEYILAYFQANGIDVKNEKVWRYEFSITSLKDKYRLEDKYTIDDITLNDENIFQFGVQRYILRYYLKLHAFAYNTGKVRFIDEKQYHILNLLSQEIPPRRVRSSRTKKKDYSAKVTISLGMQCLEYQTQCDAFITYKNILQTAKEYGLMQWLLSKYGKRLQEIYFAKSFVMYGVGIKELIQEDLFTTKTKINTAKGH
jgi:hypothetical protein